MTVGKAVGTALGFFVTLAVAEHTMKKIRKQLKQKGKKPSLSNFVKEETKI